MSTPDPTTTVTHDSDKQRYEIHVDGTLAGYATAEENGGRVVFPHTVVFDEFEGKGVASVLVAHSLDDVRNRGKKVVSTCPYVSHFIEKHPRYADLLA